MKLLADENIAKTVVRKLKSINYDIVDIQQINLRGALDKEIIRFAQKQNRIIITHDKDFIDLIQITPKPPSVILTTPSNQPPMKTFSQIKLLLSHIKQFPKKPHLYMLRCTQLTITPIN